MSKEKIEDQHVETDPAIIEFLANGGVIQKVGRNVSGRVEGQKYSAWGAPKKKVDKPSVEEVEED
jgi:hypothetical protein